MAEFIPGAPGGRADSQEGPEGSTQHSSIRLIKAFMCNSSKYFEMTHS